MKAYIAFHLLRLVSLDRTQKSELAPKASWLETSDSVYGNWCALPNWHPAQTNSVRTDSWGRPFNIDLAIITFSFWYPTCPSRACQQSAVSLRRVFSTYSVSADITTMESNLACSGCFSKRVWYPSLWSRSHNPE